MYREKFFSALFKNCIDIIIYETLFIFIYPFLVRDTFWIGIISIFLPKLYKLIIPKIINYIVIEHIFLILFSLIVLIYELLNNYPASINHLSIKGFVWVLGFDVSYPILLRILLIKCNVKVLNLIKKGKFYPLIFIFIFILILIIALCHNYIIDFIRDYVIPNIVQEKSIIGIFLKNSL